MNSFWRLTFVIVFVVVVFFLRLTAEEEERNAKASLKLVQVVEKKHPKPVLKPGEVYI